MSQSINGSGKNRKFLVDLEDDEDDFECPSDDEIEVSEDQRNMDEIVTWTRIEGCLRRSQTQESTLINSGKKKTKSHVTERTDFAYYQQEALLMRTPLLSPKNWSTVLQ